MDSYDDEPVHPELTADELDAILARSVVTWCCEHFTVSTVGVLDSLHLGCGCTAVPIVANLTASDEYL